MKIFFVIFFSLLVQNANAFWFQSKTTVLCYLKGALTSKFTYEVKGDNVIESFIVKTTSGEEKLLRMEKLDDCTVVNSKNWMCGGKVTFTAIGKQITENHSMLNGQYSFSPYQSAGNIPDICDKRVQSN